MIAAMTWQDWLGFAGAILMLLALHLQLFAPAAPGRGRLRAALGLLGAGAMLPAALERFSAPLFFPCWPGCSSTPAAWPGAAAERAGMRHWRRGDGPARDVEALRGRATGTAPSTMEVCNALAGPSARRCL